jgi:hypothetical protein
MTVEELIKELQKLDPHKPVLMWSGNDDTGNFFPVLSVQDDDDWDRVLLWEYY